MESIVFRYRTYKPPLKHVPLKAEVSERLATLKQVQFKPLSEPVILKEIKDKNESKSKPDESQKNPVYVR